MEIICFSTNFNLLYLLKTFEIQKYDKREKNGFEFV